MIVQFLNVLTVYPLCLSLCFDFAQHDGEDVLIKFFVLT